MPDSVFAWRILLQDRNITERELLYKVPEGCTELHKASYFTVFFKYNDINDKFDIYYGAVVEFVEIQVDWHVEMLVLSARSEWV